ncbi:MAG TPA: hypothetical protein VFQ91_22965 [Bryobacteraceae bacterium]|nr:hypothetical protein [Bryobacteraceae bacterium]
MRISLFFLRAAVACCLAAAAQGREEMRTTVNPLPEEEILSPCEYRMILPEAAPLRAAWVIFDRGPDHRQWYEDRRVRAFAEGQRLALVLAMHCRSKEREDIHADPDKGLGRALFTALDQLAESGRRPELARVGVIVMGWSGAGSLAARLAGFRPQRYVAGIAYAPGQYDPLGMDTISLSPKAASHPQLIIANGADKVCGTDRPYRYFRRHFEQGAPWTFAVQNGAPHCCLQNAQTLILEWLRGVLSQNAVPTAAEARGFMRVANSKVVDEWKQPVFQATAVRVADGGRARRGEIPAGWMPSRLFAQEWLLFTSRPMPVAIWAP